MRARSRTRLAQVFGLLSTVTTVDACSGCGSPDQGAIDASPRDAATGEADTGVDSVAADSSRDESVSDARVADARETGGPGRCITQRDAGVPEAGPATCIGPAFQRPRYYPGSNAPGGGIAADFNGDGALDLASTDGNSDGVQVFMGQGDGTFSAAMASAVGTSFNGIDSSDFDGDGLTDLVLAEVTPQFAVSLLLGNGDGSFRQGPTPNAGSEPLGVYVAEMNGDGLPDLVVGTVASVNILLGLGHGSFRRPTEVMLISGRSAGSSIADLNGDGKTDLLVEQGGTLNALLGNGDGSFQSPRPTPTGVVMSDFELADFTADGAPDLAVCSAWGIQIFIGNGDGTFRGGVDIPEPSYWGGGVRTADFDGDGHLDLVTTVGYFGAVVIYLGNGDGTFRETRRQGVAEGLFRGGGGPADLNCDGRPDLVIASQTGVTVLINSGCEPEPVAVGGDAGADSGDAGHHKADSGRDTGAGGSDAGGGG